MRRIIFSIVIMVVAMMPMVIDASECSNEDRNRLQNLANNVSVTLVEHDNGTFDATFSGLSNELKIYSTTTYLNYYNTLPTPIGETTIKNLKYGETYQFRLSGYAKCYSNVIKTITVNIPSKNPYYGDEVCNNAKDYSLCQKWADVDISYDEFTKKVNEYIENNKKNGNNNTNQNGKKNNFFEFYEKYYWPTFIGMICILGLLIFLWLKENKKNKL